MHQLALLGSHVLFGYPASAQPVVSNAIPVSDTSGATQTNRVVSIRALPGKARSRSSPLRRWTATLVLTQCDVKSRWPDGPLKFAIVSFRIPRLVAHGSAVIQFGSQTTAPTAGFLTQDDMLGPDHDFEPPSR